MHQGGKDGSHSIRTGYGNRLIREGTEAEGLGQYVRDATAKLPWNDQFRVNLNQIIKASMDPRVPPEERDRVLRQAEEKFEKMPEMCGPRTLLDKALQMRDAVQPTLEDTLQNAIDGHNETSSRQLPDARKVAQWDGSTRSGTFVDSGNGLVAQHQGQGSYAVADVARDLNGVQPPIGQYATLQQNGQIQVPQQTQSLGRMA